MLPLSNEISQVVRLSFFTKIIFFIFITQFMNALLFVSSTCGAQEFALKLAHEATILTPSLNFYLLPKVDSPILETRFKGETISLTPQSVQKINDAFVEHRTKDLPPFIEAINRIGGISYVKWDQLEIHFNNQTELLQNH